MRKPGLVGAVLLSIVIPWALATPTPARDSLGARVVDTPRRTEQVAFGAPEVYADETGETWPPHTPPWERPREDEDMVRLLNKYAPIIKLSSLELYFPSSIEYMLAHYTSAEADNRTELFLNTSYLTPSELDRLPRNGQGLFLDIAEEHNPQPFLLDEESVYLFGPAGQEGGMRLGEDGRGRVEEPIYAFWVDHGRGIVDLWYWTFYPFNYGKPVGPFGFLGHHVSDWERVRMRTVNGTAVSVDYNTHNGGSFSAGTVRWEDVLKVDGRPVAYSAMGSHGVWPAPGNHVYAHALKFQLVDLTDDDGALWDTKGHIVPAAFWTGPSFRRRLRHGGNDSWLNFAGHWGNKGDDDCWWHRLVGICQLVDAPPGPNRNLGTTPDCIPAPLWYRRSSFTFRLAPPVLHWATEREITHVQVEQLCARPKKEGEDEGSGSGSGMWARGGAVDYVHDQTDEEDIEVYALSGQTEFDGREEYVVETLPCKEVMSAVKSYRISLCGKEGKCLTASGERKICTYETGKPGYRFGNAVKLEDLDEWRWNLP